MRSELMVLCALLLLLGQASADPVIVEAEERIQKAKAALEKAAARTIEAKTHAKDVDDRRRAAFARYEASKKKDKAAYNEYQALQEQIYPNSVAIQEAIRAEQAAWEEKERAVDDLTKYQLRSIPAAPQTSKDVTAVYLVSETIDVRTEPNTSARVIKHLQPLDTVMVREAKPGWAHVTGGSLEGLDGWIPAKAENLIPDMLPDVAYRLVQVKKTTWPLAVQLDVVRKRPRPGFTKEQVLVAMMDFGGTGKPLTKKSSETTAGLKESWIYRGMVVHFTGDRVVEIERIE